MSNREHEATIAMRINEILGTDYKIWYDACESGMTSCYYKGVLYKEVMNSEMRDGVNAYDFAAPTELKIRLRYQ